MLEQYEESKRKKQERREEMARREQEARARHEKEAQAEVDRQRAAQAEHLRARAVLQEAEAKDRARAAWTAAGGDPDGFEAAWPGLWRSMLADRVRREQERAPIVRL